MPFWARFLANFVLASKGFALGGPSPKNMPKMLK
jgi:hypothetical protein